MYEYKQETETSVDTRTEIVVRATVATNKKATALIELLEEYGEKHKLSIDIIIAPEGD